MSSIDASQSHIVPSAAKALLVAPAKAPRPAAQMIVDVARDTGLSPIKQMREMIKLRRKAGISFPEYYAAQHYRSDRTMQEKLEFVGEVGSYNLNLRLSPAVLGDKRAILRDKVLYTAMLQGLNLPTTHTQAVAHKARGFGQITTLRTAQQVAQFLKTDAQYPLFAKPLEGSKSVGSALLTHYDAGKEMIHMGNGRAFDVSAFAEEVMTDYPGGFTFQNAVQQHDALTAVTGQAVGTMRIVTVIENNVPRVLYAVWKIPAPTAMSDNFWQSGSMLGAIDHKTGTVEHVITGSGLDRQIIEQHPVSGKGFAGLQIPDWDAAVQASCAAHHLVPEHGVFGWDIAVTNDGPVIIECNANPFHTLYQLAHDRGINNADFAPTFDAIEARGKELIVQCKAEIKEKRRAQRAA